MSSQETRTIIPLIVNELQAAIKGETTLDRTITEVEARQLLPQLLLLGEQQGFSAADVGDAVQITEKGVLEVHNARIQVNHLLFSGVITLSGEIFNREPWVLATRNTNFAIEGGNILNRPFVEKLVGNWLKNPQETMIKALSERVIEESEGTRRLDRFGIQINGGNRSARVYLSTTSVP